MRPRFRASGLVTRSMTACVNSRSFRVSTPTRLRLPRFRSSQVRPFVCMAARYTSAPRTVVGTPSSGRPYSRISAAASASVLALWASRCPSMTRRAGSEAPQPAPEQRPGQGFGKERPTGAVLRITRASEEHRHPLHSPSCSPKFTRFARTETLRFFYQMLSGPQMRLPVSPPSPRATLDA